MLIKIKIILIIETTDKTTLPRKKGFHLNLENMSMTTSIHIYPSFTSQ